MLSEKMKFAEDALKIAFEEINEEVDALFEGADVKTSGNAIKAIMKDLLESVLNFEAFQMEAKETIDVSVFTLHEGERIFLPGEVVRIKKLDFLLNSVEDLKEKMGFLKDETFYRGYEVDDIEGCEATILKVARYGSTRRPFYAIEAKGKKFFAMTKSLQEIESKG